MERGEANRDLLGLGHPEPIAEFEGAAHACSCPVHPPRLGQYLAERV